jgi:type IV pilus assembly protein PilM
MFTLNKKLKEVVGLDIGSHSIKVASIFKESDKPLLTAYNVKQIPFSGEQPVNEGQLIKEALSEVGINPSEVNISLSGSNVIVRFISLPKMTKDQLENAMIFEAERYIPFNINEVILDFIIIDDAEEGQMNVLLAAAKRDFVQGRIELFQKLGIDIGIIDVSAFAAFNAFTSANTVADDKGTAFLDLGHSQTNVLVTTGSIPRFTRVIQIGGSDITRAIVEDMGVDRQKADELRVNGGGEDSEKVDQSVFAVLDELVKEMRLSFGYFENKHNTPVSDVYCSGGMISQKGLVEYLQEKMGMQFNVWNPIAGVNIAESIPEESTNAVSAQLAVSIGLALRG